MSHTDEAPPTHVGRAPWGLLVVGILSSVWLYVVIPVLPVGALVCAVKSRQLGRARWVAILLGAVLGALGNGPWIGARADAVGVGVQLTLFGW